MIVLCQFDMPDHVPDESDDDEYIPWDCDRDYPLDNDDGE